MTGFSGNGLKAGRKNINFNSGLIVNGGFNNNSIGAFILTGSGGVGAVRSLTAPNGVAILNTFAGAAGFAFSIYTQPVTTQIGSTYRVSGRIVSAISLSGPLGFYGIRKADDAAVTLNVVNFFFNQTGEFSATFVATAVTSYIALQCNSDNANDNAFIGFDRLSMFGV